MEECYIITCDKLIENDMISFKFMFTSKAPYKEFRTLANNYGIVKLERGYWQIFIGNQGSQIFSGDAIEEPDTELVDLISDIVNCVLLMEKNLYEKFLDACKKTSVTVNCYHYEGSLSTSG